MASVGAAPDLSTNSHQHRYDFTDSRRISLLISDRGDPNKIIAAAVGPQYWDYRRRWDLARSFKYQPPFPLQVDYELFFGCQLKCPICLLSLPAAERKLYGRPGRHLALEAVMVLLKEGATRGQVAAGLNGICEPLMRQDLPEIIHYARQLGLVDVMFNTNGLLLTETVSRDLVASGLTRIMISLDAATAETYQQMRPGSQYELVVDNIKNFIKIRQEMKSLLPVVRLSFCVTSLNEHELPEFIQTWSPLVDFFSIQHYGNIFDPPAARDRDSLFPVHYRYTPDAAPRCAQPWKRALVRHNGDVIPCCDASGLRLTIGNIYEQTLESIWQGDRAQEIRNRHQQGRALEDPICRTCLTKWEPTSAPGGRERQVNS